MRVDSARDTICDFDVQFGNDVFLRRRRDVSVDERKEWVGQPTRVDASLADISHCSTLDHVSHREALDRLVLGDSSRAVGAPHELDMPSSLLVSAAISSLLGLCRDSISATSSNEPMRHPSRSWANSTVPPERGCRRMGSVANEKGLCSPCWECAL